MFRVARIVLLAVLAGTLPFGLAAPLPAATMHSTDFTYRYDFGDGLRPDQSDANNNGTSDFSWVNTANGTASVGNGILTMETTEVAGDNCFLSSAAGQAWPVLNPTAGYTVEARVKIVTDLTRPISIMASPSNTNGHAYLNIGATGQQWATTTALGGSTDNTDGFHTFRIAYDTSTYSVWRDGVLLNDSLSDGGNWDRNRLLFGDISGSHGGKVEVDYFRFTAGTYAPNLFRTIASYHSGVPAMASAAGAANPVDQGWTVHEMGTWAHGYDSGDGGWRIVDATSGSNPHYSYALTSEDRGYMSVYGWTLDFTFSMDRHAKRLTGNPLVIDDYYCDTNRWRQNNQTVLIENAEAGYRYDLKFLIDENADLWVFDGTEDTLLGSTPSFDLYGTHQLTSDGSAYEDFKSMRISFTGGTATLLFDGQEFALAPKGSAGLNQVVFGSAGPNAFDVQGSAVWNEVTLRAIPEPGALSLLLCGAIAGLMWRCRR